MTTRMTSTIKKAIATIPDDGWETIRYTDAVFDEDTGRWISSAEVAEVPFTAFTSQKKADHVPGGLGSVTKVVSASTGSPPTAPSPRSAPLTYRNAWHTHDAA